MYKPNLETLEKILKLIFDFKEITIYSHSNRNELEFIFRSDHKERIFISSGDLYDEQGKINQYRYIQCRVGQGKIPNTQIVPNDRFHIGRTDPKVIGSFIDSFVKIECTKTNFKKQKTKYIKINEPTYLYFKIFKIDLLPFLQYF